MSFLRACSHVHFSSCRCPRQNLGYGEPRGFSCSGNICMFPESAIEDRGWVPSMSAPRFGLFNMIGQIRSRSTMTFVAAWIGMAILRHEEPAICGASSKLLHASTSLSRRPDVFFIVFLSSVCFLSASYTSHIILKLQSWVPSGPPATRSMTGMSPTSFRREAFSLLSIV